MKNLIKNLLQLNTCKEIDDLNDVTATLLHSDIIKSKGFLKKLYSDFYGEFTEHLADTPEGPSVEVGSGGGFFKDVMEDVITSDVVAVPGIDIVFSAENMPFHDSSLSTIFLLNTLHHIKDPKKFFVEVSRCLKRNGIVVMIEPTNSYLARLIFKNFHHEHFDEKAKKWELSGDGRLSDANQAMPWLIFVRDRKTFELIFPNLSITYLRKHTPFCYWLSGGVSLKQLAPSFSYGLFREMENILSPFREQMGCFMTVVLVNKQLGS